MQNNHYFSVLAIQLPLLPYVGGYCHALCHLTVRLSICSTVRMFVPPSIPTYSPQSIWPLCSSCWILVLCPVSYHNGHKPKGQNLNGHKPKRPLTGTATNRNGHKPQRQQTETATNRNSHKPKRSQTRTATNRKAPHRNGHKPEWSQTETATNRNGHKPERPKIRVDTTFWFSGLHNCVLDMSFKLVSRSRQK